MAVDTASPRARGAYPSNLITETGIHDPARQPALPVMPTAPACRDSPDLIGSMATPSPSNCRTIHVTLRSRRTLFRDLV